MSGVKGVDERGCLEGESITIQRQLQLWEEVAGGDGLGVFEEVG